MILSIMQYLLLRSVITSKINTFLLRNQDYRWQSVCLFDNRLVYVPFMYSIKNYDFKTQPNYEKKITVIKSSLAHANRPNHIWM
jgi:hypothetical protein